MYEIIDKTTKRVVGRAKTLKAARRSIDRRDNAYGCYQFTWRLAESRTDADL